MVFLTKDIQEVENYLLLKAMVGMGKLNMRQWQLLLMSLLKHVEGSEVKEEGAHEAGSVNVDTVNSTDIAAVEAMHNESSAEKQGHDVTGGS
jgi:hypothetical protein